MRAELVKPLKRQNLRRARGVRTTCEFKNAAGRFKIGLWPGKGRLGCQRVELRKAQDLHALGRDGADRTSPPLAVLRTQQVGPGFKRHHGNRLCARHTVHQRGVGPGGRHLLAVADDDIAPDAHIHINGSLPFQDGKPTRRLDREPGERCRRCCQTHNLQCAVPPYRGDTQHRDRLDAERPLPGPDIAQLHHRARGAALIQPFISIPARLKLIGIHKARCGRLPRDAGQYFDRRAIARDVKLFAGLWRPRWGNVKSRRQRCARRRLIDLLLRGIPVINERRGLAQQQFGCQARACAHLRQIKPHSVNLKGLALRQRRPAKPPAVILDICALTSRDTPGLELARHLQAHLPACALQLNLCQALRHGGRDREGQRDIAPDPLAIILQPVGLTGIGREVIGLPAVLWADKLAAHRIEVRRPALPCGQHHPAFTQIICRERRLRDPVGPRPDTPLARLPDAAARHGRQHGLDNGLGCL